MKKVLMIRPKDPVTFWSFNWAVKALGKKTAFPALALLTIAGSMPEDEYDLRVVDMNVGDLTDEDLSWADVVLTSSMIIHWDSLKEVIARCNGLKVPVLCGGPLPTQYHAEIEGDAVFYLGEAENGFLDVVERMLADDYEICREVVDYRGEFLSLEITPTPRWDLITLDDYSSMVVQGTRGCPEKCTFCNIPALYGKITRLKDNITVEMDALYSAGWRGSIMWVDDNFIGNADKICQSLEEEIIPWQERHGFPFRFNTQASIRVSDNPRLMRSMLQAGFDRIFAGIESPVKESLKSMGAQKNLQGDTPLLDKVNTLQTEGFEVQAGFIMGLDTDPENIGDVMLEFIREAGIPIAMVGPLGVLPDTADYKRYERKGRLVKDVRYGGDSGVLGGKLSFVPKLGSEWLLSQHRNLVSVLNSPEIFFERCLTMFKKQKPPPMHSKLAIGYPEIRATMLSLWHQGIAGNYRMAYWKFLGKVVRDHRIFLPNAVRLAVMGHHLITTTEQALRVDDVRTFMDIAADEFRELAQGSRVAFRSAEARACLLVDRVRSRLGDVQDGLPDLHHSARILKKAASKYRKSVGPMFRSQLDEQIIRFRAKLDSIVVDSQQDEMAQ